jgi:hypothetical protein
VAEIVDLWMVLDPKDSDTSVADIAWRMNMPSHVAQCMASDIDSLRLPKSAESSLRAIFDLLNYEVGYNNVVGF